jgi:succinate dehydrogenase / fumarate reductase iron-sulfur subunit
MDQCIVKILRGIAKEQYFEEFIVPLTPGLNITSVLLMIQKNPINKEGKKVAPVAWEQGCLEEVCGSCTLLINGRPRQGCSALVRTLLAETGSNIITLAPLTKFPLIRDLVVSRDSMFDSLKKVNAWVDVDDAFDHGYGPKRNPSVEEVRYELSTCMTCGCCLEACPQVNEHTKFMGAAAISQVRLFNAEETGKLQKDKRLRALQEEGGVAECGNAQNCVAVCPKHISLTESIALMQRHVNIQAWKDLFDAPDI